MRGASPADLLQPLRRRLAKNVGRCGGAAARLVGRAGSAAGRTGAGPLQRRRRRRRPAHRACRCSACRSRSRTTSTSPASPTTAACPAFAHVAERSANVVQRLLEAGAVWIGKTNLDQFATGLVGTRSPYGAPASCFAAERISGGSSSGSAVVVVARRRAVRARHRHRRLGPRAGRLQQLVGLKPTPGGSAPAAWCRPAAALDCVSVFALTVDDAARGAGGASKGPTRADPYSRSARAAPRCQPRLRVGVPIGSDLLRRRRLRRRLVERACAALAALGTRSCRSTSAPLDDVAALLYDGPWVAERHAVVEALLRRRDPEAFDPVVRGVIGAARGYSATDAFRGQYRLRALAAQARRDLGRHRPADGADRARRIHASPTIAADPVGVNAQLGTLHQLRQPARLVRAGAAGGHGCADGLPFGVTFIAPGSDDAALARTRPRLAACRRPAAGRDRPRRCRRAATSGAGVAADRSGAADRRGRRASLGPAAERPTGRARRHAARGDDDGAALPAATRCPARCPPKPGLVRDARGAGTRSRSRSGRCRCSASATSSR